MPLTTCSDVCGQTQVGGPAVHDRLVKVVLQPTQSTQSLIHWSVSTIVLSKLYCNQHSQHNHSFTGHCTGQCYGHYHSGHYNVEYSGYLLLLFFLTVVIVVVIIAGVPSPMRPCREAKQSAQHIPQDCRDHRLLREEIWPTQNRPHSTSPRTAGITGC